MPDLGEGIGFLPDYMVREAMEKSLLVTRQIHNPRQDSRMLLATRHSASGQVTQWIKREFSLQGILTGIYQDLMHRAWCTGWQFYLSVHQWDKWRAISEINNELEWVTWVLVNRNEILFLYAIDKSGIEIIPTGNSESGAENATNHQIWIIFITVSAWLYPIWKKSFMILWALSLWCWATRVILHAGFVG